MNKKGVSPGEIVVIIIGLVVALPIVAIGASNLQILTAQEIPIQQRIELSFKKPMLNAKGEVLHNLLGENIFTVVSLGYGRILGTTQALVGVFNSIMGPMMIPKVYTNNEEIKTNYEFGNWVGQQAAICWDMYDTGELSIPLYKLKNPANCFYTTYDLTQRQTLKIGEGGISWFERNGLEYTKIDENTKIYDLIKNTDYFSGVGLLEYVLTQNYYYFYIQGKETTIEGILNLENTNKYDDCEIETPTSSVKLNPSLCYFNKNSNHPKIHRIQCQEITKETAQSELAEFIKNCNDPDNENVKYTLENDNTITINYEINSEKKTISISTKSKQNTIYITTREWEQLINNLKTGNTWIIDYYYGARYNKKTDWEIGIYKIEYDHYLLSSSDYGERNWIKTAPCTNFAVARYLKDSQKRLRPVCWKNYDTLPYACDDELNKLSLTKGIFKGAYKDVSGSGDPGTWDSCTGRTGLSEEEPEGVNIGHFGSSAIFGTSYDRVLFCIEDYDINTIEWKVQTLDTPYDEKLKSMNCFPEGIAIGSDATGQLADLAIKTSQDVLIGTTVGWLGYATLGGTIGILDAGLIYADPNLEEYRADWWRLPYEE